MDLYDKHIEMVEKVNNSKTEAEHSRNEARLEGFRECMHFLGYNQLMECDLHYINKGYRGPLCCGVFLDWEPSE